MFWLFDCSRYEVNLCKAVSMFLLLLEFWLFWYSLFLLGCPLFGGIFSLLTAAFGV